MFDNLNVDDGNQVIVDLLQQNEPFCVARLAGALSTISMSVDRRVNPDVKSVQDAITNDGMYHNNNDELLQLIENYISGIQSADYLACFEQLVIEEQKYFLEKFKHIKTIHSRALESFYTDQTPWTKSLNDCRVLVVSSHTNSFSKQIADGNLPAIWNKDQQFELYKSYNTLANNKPHNNCLETLSVMKDDISKLDFEVAILGCGGYGLMLCDHIKHELKKSCIYIGGSLQLLFGVLGRRWVSNTLVRERLNNFNNFIFPVDQDKIDNFETIEFGCYW